MNIGADRPKNQSDRSDEDLIELVRSGDAEAYGVLFERHHGVALSVARKNSDNSSDAEDAVSEAFSSVFQALKAGKGPISFFRAYLLSAVTRIAHRRNVAAGKISATEDNAVLDRQSSDPDLVTASFESDAVSRAFKELPERWQAVLWYLDIEGMKPAAVAPILGLSANGVSALAIRARDGLRRAYLQNHLRGGVQDACAGAAAKLGSYAMNTLRRSQRIEVKDHLDGCLRCTEALGHLEDVRAAMRATVFPAVVGFGYVAWSQSGAGLVAGKSLLFLPKTDSAPKFSMLQQLKRLMSVPGHVMAATTTGVAGIALVTAIVAAQMLGFWTAPPALDATSSGQPINSSQSGQSSSSGEASSPSPADGGESANPGRVVSPGDSGTIKVPLLPVSEGTPESPETVGPSTGGSTSGGSGGAVSPSTGTPATAKPDTSTVIPPTTQPTVKPPIADQQTEISAVVNTSGLFGSQQVSVEFSATGTQALTSVKAVFRLDSKSGAKFGDWTKQPRGWQCTADGDYLATCVATSADRADLKFSGTIVTDPLAGPVTLFYDFTADKVKPFSGQKVLRAMQGIAQAPIG